MARLPVSVHPDRPEAPRSPRSLWSTSAWSAVPVELTDPSCAATLLSGDSMSQLIVRNLDPKVVEALQRRAASHGRSAEAEHREILREALLIDAEASAFKEWLLAMPNVGDDADFERSDELPRDVEL